LPALAGFFLWNNYGYETENQEQME